MFAGLPRPVAKSLRKGFFGLHVPVVVVVLDIFAGHHRLYVAKKPIPLLQHHHRNGQERNLVTQGEVVESLCKAFRSLRIIQQPLGIEQGDTCQREGAVHTICARASSKYASCPESDLKIFATHCAPPRSTDHSSYEYLVTSHDQDEGKKPPAAEHTIYTNAQRAVLVGVSTRTGMNVPLSSSSYSFMQYRMPPSENKNEHPIESVQRSPCVCSRYWRPHAIAKHRQAYQLKRCVNN